MMNKKGAGGITAFLTSSLVFAAMAFIIFSLVGVGGGFKAAFDVGKFLSDIPVWFWIVAAVFWLARSWR